MIGSHGTPSSWCVAIGYMLATIALSVSTRHASAATTDPPPPGGAVTAGSARPPVPSPSASTSLRSSSSTPEPKSAAKAPERPYCAALRLPAPCRPAVISDWEPDEGIPPGYEVEKRFNLARLITGSVGMGTLWLATMVTVQLFDGSAGERAAAYVPIVGPLMAISTLEAKGAEASVLTVSGLGQAAGFVLFLTGFLSDDVLIRPSTETMEKKAFMMIAPQLGQRHIGLKLWAEL